MERIAVYETADPSSTLGGGYQIKLKECLTMIKQYDLIRGIPNTEWKIKKV